jgi:hypothetical protein
MKILDCVIATLLRHREARHWSDAAVAADLVGQLGLDPGGEAANPTSVVDPSLVTDDQVVAAEAAADKAGREAGDLRSALNAQNARVEPELDAFASSPFVTTPLPTSPPIEVNAADAQQADADRLRELRAASEAGRTNAPPIEPPPIAT